MNWSYLAHAIGDMHDDDEFGVVRVKEETEDGHILIPVKLERDIDGEWILVCAICQRDNDAGTTQG